MKTHQKKETSSTDATHRSKGRPSPDAHRVQAFQANMQHTPKQQHLTQLQADADAYSAQTKAGQLTSHPDIVQQKPLKKNTLNVVGEEHKESKPRRTAEEQYTKKNLGEKAFYVTEYEYYVTDKQSNKKEFGDPSLLRIEQVASTTSEMLEGLESTYDRHKKITEDIEGMGEDQASLKQTQSAHLLDLEQLMGSKIKDILKEIDRIPNETNLLELKKEGKNEYFAAVFLAIEGAKTQAEQKNIGRFIHYCKKLIERTGKVLGQGVRPKDKINLERSMSMHEKAQKGTGYVGVWKVGDNHVKEIQANTPKEEQQSYHLMTKDEFNEDFDSKDDKSCAIQ